MKILISGITMVAAGTERSFLTYAESLDCENNEITLLLAEKSGALLPYVPDGIKTEEMKSGGALFTMNGKNAKSVLLREFVLRHPLCALKAARYLPLYIRNRGFAAMRIWLCAMRSLPPFDGEYDEAVAYWGDKTMFFVADKVRAKKKTAWLHFEYDYPPREDALYGEYFEKFDSIVCVSRRSVEMLREKFPHIAGRFTYLENETNESLVRQLGEAPCPEMETAAVKLLTVGRVNPVKGYDIALPAVANLINAGYNIKWYIVGACDDFGYKAELEREAERFGVRERLIFIGETDNPYRFMRACDIYLQPSRSESCGLALREASVFGKTTVCTDIPSAAHAKKCFICEKTSDSVFKSLKKILDAQIKEQFLG